MTNKANGGRLKGGPPRSPEGPRTERGEALISRGRRAQQHIQGSWLNI